MKKTILFSMLLFAVTSASAQYVHIELKNGEKYDYDSKDIKTMTVDTKQPVKKVEGTVTIGGKTYTKTVGGTVGEAVDLGLSVKWASHNIGASQPEEYGAYLAWGEVGAKEEGYVDGVKYNKEGRPYYNWDNLKYSEGTTYQGPFSKYVASSSYGTVDKLTVLESMDDAATVNWGDGWRMPTYEEQTELRTKCTWTWVTTDVKDASGNFIKGYKVVGPNGNSIFLPASGHRIDSSLYYVGSWGNYWSSSLRTSYSGHAYYPILQFEQLRLARPLPQHRVLRSPRSRSELIWGSHPPRERTRDSPALLLSCGGSDFFAPRAPAEELPRQKNQRCRRIKAM